MTVEDMDMMTLTPAPIGHANPPPAAGTAAGIGLGHSAGDPLASGGAHEITGDGEPPAEGPELTGGTPEQQEAALEALRSIYDPEIPVNICDLGLIYAVHFESEGVARVVMTLTSPGCPAAVILPGEVEEKIAAVHGVASAQVEVVWEPPWSPERMSEAARLELGMM